MNDPQAIVLDYFARAAKSEGIRQWPKFYKKYEMDDYRHLVRFPFRIRCDAFKKNNSK